MAARAICGARLKKHRTYTVEEAADTLGVTQQTVRTWLKTGGLSALTKKRPTLILGDVLKTWLKGRDDKRRRPMAADEVFCLTCKAPRKPDPELVEYKPQTETNGRVHALCPVCGGLCARIIRASDRSLFGMGEAAAGNAASHPYRNP